MRLDSLAIAIRSKNAGPCLLTFDIIFPSEESFERAIAAVDALQSYVSNTYRKALEDVQVFIYRPSRAIKVTIPRDRMSGSLGDPDVYGAQQHAPLLAFTL